MSQRRFVAMLLLAGSLVFWGGAVATLFPVDAKGTSIYLLPAEQRIAGNGGLHPPCAMAESSATEQQHNSSHRDGALSMRAQVWGW